MATLACSERKVEERAVSGREPMQKRKMGKLVPQGKHEESLNPMEIRAL